MENESTKLDLYKPIRVIDSAGHIVCPCARLGVLKDVLTGYSEFYYIPDRFFKVPSFSSTEYYYNNEDEDEIVLIKPAYKTWRQQPTASSYDFRLVKGATFMYLPIDTDYSFKKEERYHCSYEGELAVRSNKFPLGIIRKVWLFYKRRYNIEDVNPFRVSYCFTSDIFDKLGNKMITLKDENDYTVGYQMDISEYDKEIIDNIKTIMIRGSGDSNDSIRWVDILHSFKDKNVEEKVRGYSRVVMDLEDATKIYFLSYTVTLKRYLNKINENN